MSRAVLVLAALVTLVAAPLAGAVDGDAFAGRALLGEDGPGGTDAGARTAPGARRMLGEDGPGGTDAGARTAPGGGGGGIGRRLRVADPVDAAMSTAPFGRRLARKVLATDNKATADAPASGVVAQGKENAATANPPVNAASAQTKENSATANPPATAAGPPTREDEGHRRRL